MSVDLHDVLAELMHLDSQIAKMTVEINEKKELMKSIMEDHADLLLHGTKKAVNTFDIDGATVAMEIKAVDRKTYHPDVELVIQREKARYKSEIESMENHHKSMEKKIKVEAQNSGKFDTKRSYYCKVEYK